MKYYFSLLLLTQIVFTPISVAQNYVTKKNAPEKALKFFKKGQELGRQNQYKKAVKEYKKALKSAPNFIDARLFLADAYYAQKQFEQAEKEFESVVALGVDYKPRVLYVLGALEYKLDKFEEAAAHLKQFKTFEVKSTALKNRAEKLRLNSLFAAEAIKNPLPYQPTNLGDINSEDPEYLPSLTADGATMIYTRRVGRQEDFYKSQKINGAWQKGEPLGPPINTLDNEGAQSVSADGRFLVYTVCNRENDFGSCDLYFATATADGWSPPQNIGHPINTKTWESQPALSADGRTLFFVSSRQGGLGGKDIWVTYKKNDGKWTKPQNLGAAINTKGDDESPFFHADGQTLYFRSNGRVGMGGFDLYSAKRQFNGTWSDPINLGYPINTKADEGSLVVSLDGTTAYFASDQLGVKGAIDLYSFEMPKAIRPNPVTYVNATVFDAVSKGRLEAKIELIELKSGVTYTSATTTANGEFLVCLPIGNDYAFNISKAGYLFYSENFALKEITTRHEPIQMKVPLQKIPLPATNPIAKDTPTKPTVDKSMPIVLKNVFFETGSAALKPASATELKFLINLLNNNPTIRIQINGHTDNVGSEADNLVLSKNRAQAVVNYLVQEGIASERLLAKGFGETQPIADNADNKGRQQNRRTEFQIIN